MPMRTVLKIRTCLGFILKWAELLRFDMFEDASHLISISSGSSIIETVTSCLINNFVGQSILYHRYVCIDIKGLREPPAQLRR
jgi:hypothetical protein